MQYTPADFRNLWREFRDASWNSWADIENVAFGVPPADLKFVKSVTRRTNLPSKQVRELWAVVGRGGGKSRWCARLAVYFATGRDYRTVPGENLFIGVFAPDRKQAQLTFKYTLGLLESVPALQQLIVRKLKDSIELSNGIVIEVITASTSAPRGRSYALCIVEEAAFLPTDDSATPDTELLRAVRPALARVPGSMLVVVSSPYARRGELYKAWKRHFGKDSDTVLVVQADTLTMNPAFDVSEIERAVHDDITSAEAEYFAQFRKDIQEYAPREAIEACVISGRREVPRVPGITYYAFVDPSGGGSDSFTIAIGHTEGTRDKTNTTGDLKGDISIAVIDVVRERRPPFSTEAVVQEYAALLKQYGIREVEGDRYGGQWPRESFRRYGITYELAGKSKSDLYKDALAVLNSGRVDLLDNDRLIAQLASLERRTGRGGKDSIDHAPNAHDDLANVVCGLIVKLAVSRPEYSDFLVWPDKIGREIELPLLNDPGRERCKLCNQPLYLHVDIAAGCDLLSEGALSTLLSRFAIGKLRDDLQVGAGTGGEVVANIPHSDSSTQSDSHGLTWRERVHGQ